MYLIHIKMVRLTQKIKLRIITLRQRGTALILFSSYTTSDLALYTEDKLEINCVTTFKLMYIFMVSFSQDAKCMINLIYYKKTPNDA